MITIHVQNWSYEIDIKRLPPSTPILWWTNCDSATTALPPQHSGSMTVTRDATRGQWEW